MDTKVIRRNFLQRLAQVVLKMANLDSFFNSITKMTVEVFEVIWVTLSLLDKSAGRCTLVASSRQQEQCGQDNELRRIDDSTSWLKNRQRIVRGRLLEKFGQLMVSELKEELEKADISVSLPLFAGDEFTGILNLGPKINKGSFSKQELALLAEVAELIGVITKQAVAYHNVSEQRLHHQNILDNLVSGIIAIDLEDKITVFNRTAEKILNVKSDEVLGNDVRILQENLVNLLLETLHKNKSYRREELYILPENTLIGVSTSQFFDDKKELLGACMVFNSLAAAKKKQELLQRKNLNIYWSNVAISLAHEVKNSIMATKTFAEMFPEKYKDADFRSSLHSTLKRDMEKLDRFSENLLNFAQPQQLVIQPCQINQVIDGAIALALQDRDVGTITFEKQYAQDCQPLPGDYHQLKQAFVCIISNALEAMDEKKGKLTISTECWPKTLSAEHIPEMFKSLPQDNAVVVKIQDTGCGISSQNSPYLFDPFFTTKAGRAGLGLSTARKIVERHQGLIVSKSKIQEGSTFWIYLPVLATAKSKN